MKYAKHPKAPLGGKIISKPGRTVKAFCVWFILRQRNKSRGFVLYFCYLFFPLVEIFDRARHASISQLLDLAMSASDNMPTSSRFS